MERSFGVRVTGPLEPYASGFGAELTRLGYTFFSARMQLWLVGHLSWWLAGQGVGGEALTESTVAQYLLARRAAGYSYGRSAKVLAPLLDYLRGLGVAPIASVVTPGTPAEVLLDRYRAYLLGERAMTPAAVRGYVDSVRPLLAIRTDDGGGVDLAGMTGADVTAFVVGQCRRLAPKTAQRMTSALRSFLRFLTVEGLVDAALVVAVPSVANWKLAGLPQALDPIQVDALLASCDRDTVVGSRDFAVMTLLARLGLRAGEVAGLRLDDLDWRHGEILVRGKGNRLDRLPVPVDVGQAVVDYLQRGRPSDAQGRWVFIRVLAPHRGLTSCGVTQIVAAAGLRAGLGTIYAHRLRHSAATAMVRAGAPLTEVGQVLRHQRALTTAIYAKVDVEGLRDLARPWPGGAA